VTDSTATAVAVSDLSQYTDWTQGRLVFEKTPVPVLLATVGRWYGYQFRLADSTLALDRISVVLKTTDLSDMLTSLKSVLDVTMVFDGSVITLTPRRALPRRPIRRTVKFSPSMEMGR
jgi:ferric-dicitrate binding protein FerR (iron transport regulator)